MVYNQSVRAVLQAPPDVTTTMEVAAMTRVQRTCTVDGCKGKHEAKGLCHKHYEYNRLFGTPFASVIVGDNNARFWSKVKKTEHCWFWVGTVTKWGYGQFSTVDRRFAAHRYSYSLAHGSIPDGLFVCHSCDNRNCVNPAHLWVGTAQENMTDMQIKGRGYHPCGEGAANAVLSTKQVAAVRGLLEVGMPQREIAAAFGVSQTCVSDIKTGRRRLYG